MTDDAALRIITIDDNPNIHKDFIKILTANRSSPKLDLLEQELFGAEKTADVVMLPKFEIDTASQGQEGVARIKNSLSESRPYALAFC